MQSDIHTYRSVLLKAILAPIPTRVICHSLLQAKFRVLPECITGKCMHIWTSHTLCKNHLQSPIQLYKSVTPVTLQSLLARGCFYQPVLWNLSLSYLFWIVLSFGTPICSMILSWYYYFRFNDVHRRNSTRVIIFGDFPTSVVLPGFLADWCCTRSLPF